jgi:hypothetical protein
MDKQLEQLGKIHEVLIEQGYKYRSPERYEKDNMEVVMRLEDNGVVLKYGTRTKSIDRTRQRDDCNEY